MLLYKLQRHVEKRAKLNSDIICRLPQTSLTNTSILHHPRTDNQFYDSCDEQWLLEQPNILSVFLLFVTFD